MTKRAKIVKILCGCDPGDEAFLNGFETSLSLLATSGQIEIWCERDILAGANQQQEIEGHLKESDIVLLLVSPQFLVSHYQQMIQAMDLHKASKISYVIPILIRHSGWEQSPIGKLQPLPRDRRPVKQWKDRDEAFEHVVGEIKKVVDLLLSEPQQQSDEREGFIFIGQYPTNGYRWDNDLRPAPGLVKQKNMPDAPWLVSQAVGILELSQRYSIFDEKNVLRDFAELSPTAEAIKQFADCYGHLANPDLVPLYYPDKVGQPDSILWAGESLQFWLEEIEEMNILVTLWEMIQNRQIELLMEHIVWQLNSMGVQFIWKGRYGAKCIWFQIVSVPRFTYSYQWR